jgi:hypothetical protein
MDIDPPTPQNRTLDNFTLLKAIDVEFGQTSKVYLAKDEE